MENLPPKFIVNFPHVNEVFTGEGQCPSTDYMTGWGALSDNSTDEIWYTLWDDDGLKPELLIQVGEIGHQTIKALTKSSHLRRLIELCTTLNVNGGIAVLDTVNPIGNTEDRSHPVHGFLSSLKDDYILYKNDKGEIVAVSGAERNEKLSEYIQKLVAAATVMNKSEGEDLPEAKRIVSDPISKSLFGWEVKHIPSFLG